MNKDSKMKEDKMTGEEFNTYDILVNDEDEAMLLLYAREGKPENATFEVDPENRAAVLHRRPEDDVFLDEIPEDVLDSLADADKLLVCELSIEEDEKDTQIVYAYEAEVND